MAPNNGITSLHPREVVLVLDEFDKTCEKIHLINQQQKKLEKQYLSYLQHIISEKPSKNLDESSKNDEKGFVKPKKNDEEDYNWSLDDLLTILCGSIIPPGRIIVATANNISLIRKYCPALLRPGRLTPIHFDYGDSKLFCQIVKDYVNIEIKEEELPTNYKFIHSALVEYLLSIDDLTKEIIIEKLPIFKPDYIGIDESIDESIDKDDVENIKDDKDLLTKPCIDDGMESKSIEELMSECD